MSIDVAHTAMASFTAQVGTEIKVAMVRAGVSGRQLAARINRSQTWVSTRLNGTTPIDLNDLALFAEALGVDPTQLLPRAKPGINGSYAAQPVRPVRRAIVRTVDHPPIDRGPRSPSAVRPISSVPISRRRPGPVRPMAGRP